MLSTRQDNIELEVDVPETSTAALNPHKASDDDGSESYPDINNDPQESDDNSSIGGSVSGADNNDEDHDRIDKNTQE